MYSSQTCIKQLLLTLVLICAFIATNLTSSTAQQVQGYRKSKTKQHVQLVPFRAGTKWGFSDTTGVLLTKAKYDGIILMPDSNFIVLKYEKHWPKWGLVSRSGKTIVPPVYNEIYDVFTSGIYSSYMGKYNIDKNTYSLSKNNKIAGVVNYKGELTKLKQPKYPYHRYLNSGKFAVGHHSYESESARRGERRLGIMYNGRLITELKYMAISELSSGYILLMDPNGKKSLMNKKGKIVFSSKDEISDFSYGLVYVDECKDFFSCEKNCKDIGCKAFYKEDGEIAFPDRFRTVKWNYKLQVFNDGLAAVSKDGKMYGFIDTTGRLVIDYMYEDALPFDNGAAIVKKNGLWGMVDKEGHEIVPFIYHCLAWKRDVITCGTKGSYANTKYENILVARVDNQAFEGLFNPVTNKAEIKYAHVYPTPGGLRYISKESRASYFNMQGIEVFPCDEDIQYLGFSYNGGGLIAFNYIKDDTAKSKIGFIDTTCRVIIPPVFDNNSSGGSNSFNMGFLGGVHYVEIQGKSAYINSVGKVITTPYEMPTIKELPKNFVRPAFKEGYGGVLIKITNQLKPDSMGYILIDTAGKQISEMIFTKVGDFSSGLSVVCQATGCGLIDTNGKIILPLKYSLGEKVLDFYSVYTYRKPEEPQTGYIQKEQIQIPGSVRLQKSPGGTPIGYISTSGTKYWRD